MDKVGYFKLEGTSLSEGVFSARGTAELLLAVDGITKSIINGKYATSGEIEYEIPVKVEKGSVVLWVMGAVGTAYLSSYASTVAKNDAKDITSKEILEKTIQAVIWFIKVSKHLKTTTWKNLQIVDWKEDNKIVEVQNDEGEKMLIPAEFITIWNDIDTDKFSMFVEPINDDLHVEVGIGEANEDSVSIYNDSKDIFYTEPTDPLIILPELEEGKYVELEGKITKINEKYKTLGFEYEGHILVAKPAGGSLLNYKEVLVAENTKEIFAEVIIGGLVSRTYRSREGISKPQIIFDKLTPFEGGNDPAAQQTLGYKE